MTDCSVFQSGKLPTLRGTLYHDIVEVHLAGRVVAMAAHLKGKICRIAHMGYMDLFDVLTALSALEIVLNGLGFAIDPGSGPGAAEKIFLEESS